MAGAVVGLGLAYVLSLDLFSTPAPVSPDLPAAAAASESPEPAPAPASPGAVDAQTAVEVFLDAEAQRDYAGSYDMLSAADLQQVPSVAEWIAVHADVLPPILGYQVEQTTVDGARAEVVTIVQFEPDLNPVVGLAPGQAQITWTAIAEDDGGWRVALGDSRIEPIYPPDEEAVSAVASWVMARQGCQSGVSAGEHDGGLLGLPSAADALCGTTGEVNVDLSTPLSAADAAPFVAEFGPEFELWSRVVAVQSPGLRVVVAPVGSEWLVIGVLGGGAP
ncbi:MAG: hypothetical protein H0V96_03475 [Acidimicrobiia bacterium]|nr:hypothetical protein [Acidimicrobiia bacterium]